MCPAGLSGGKVTIVYSGDEYQAETPIDTTLREETRDDAG
jgi:hypothetical protein